MMFEHKELERKERGVERGQRSKDQGPGKAVVGRRAVASNEHRFVVRKTRFVPLSQYNFTSRNAVSPTEANNETSFLELS